MKFEDHLESLRRSARKWKIQFSDLLLMRLFFYQKRPRQFRLGEAYGDVLETNLIDEYRPVFRKVLSSKGGKAAAQSKRDNGLNDRNARVIEKAKKLIRQGRSRRELAGIIALIDGRTPRQIRNVLKEVK